MTQAQGNPQTPPRGWAWYISQTQAIIDYELIDVTECARKLGITWPVALTSTAYSECATLLDGDRGRDAARQCSSVARQKVQQGPPPCPAPGQAAQSRALDRASMNK